MFTSNVCKGLIVLSAIAVIAISTLAQTPAPANRPNAKRFLFVLETSSDMKKSAEAVKESIGALIDTAMGGTMDEGDTFGIWTFNEQLQAGDFPMQKWTRSAAADIEARVADYLEKRRYEKNAKLDKVMPKLSPLISSSRTLTVILVTSGKQTVQGTPFDQQINAFFKENQRQFEKNKTPFVTTLLAHNGQIIRHSVSPIFEVAVPKPPSPVATIVEKPKPEPAVVTNSPPPPQPPQKTTTETPTPSIADSPKELKIALPVTPAATRPVVPESTIITSTNPALQADAIPSPNVATRSNQALVIGKKGAQIVVATNKGGSLEDAVADVISLEQDAIPTEPTPTEQTEAIETSIEKQESPVPATTTKPVLSSATAPAPSSSTEPVPELVVATPPVESTNSTIDSTPKPAPISARETLSAATASPSVTNAGSQQVATAAPVSGTNRILLSGIVLVIIAIGLAFWLGRATAKPSRPSFITQSVDRRDKK